MEKRNVLMIFTQEIMYKPIIYRLSREYDIIFNVLEAKILPKQEGRIILEFKGTPDKIEESINYLKSEGVQIEILATKIKRDENRCIHCGACTGVCRTDALMIERPSMVVLFNPEKCIACGLCKLACPTKAMSGFPLDKDIDILS